MAWFLLAALLRLCRICPWLFYKTCWSFIVTGVPGLGLSLLLLQATCVLFSRKNLDSTGPGLSLPLLLWNQSACVQSEALDNSFLTFAGSSSEDSSSTASAARRSSSLSRSFLAASAVADVVVDEAPEAGAEAPLPFPFAAPFASTEELSASSLSAAASTFFAQLGHSHLGGAVCRVCVRACVRARARFG